MDGTFARPNAPIQRHGFTRIRIMMGRSFLLFSLALTTGMATGMAVSAAEERQATEWKPSLSEAHPVQGSGVKNNVFFVSGDAGNPHMQQMKERLTDPAQRA